MTNETNPKSLVLIVGAGASKEVNLPIGSELISHIAKSLSFKTDGYSISIGEGDERIYSSLFQLANQSNGSNSSSTNLMPYMQASRHIADAMPLAPSIDNFINSHQPNQLIAICGKLAIASCILKAESKSSLYIDLSNTYNKIKIKNTIPNWFSAFFKTLTTDCRITDLNERLSKVSIISFNYDRCIEHYLFHTLQIYYGINKEEAAAALTHLEIFHPYGTVGKLPWQSQIDGIEFGATPHPPQLIAVSKQIQTFTEGIDESKSDILSIRETVANARRIAFLGFAFHPLNLELLFSNTKYSSFDSHQNSIYATAHGISTSDIQHIKNELVRVAGFQESSIHLRSDLLCSQIFYEYSRGLSLN
jgi:hypothetical protein